MDNKDQNKVFTSSAELYRLIIDKVVENPDSPYKQLMSKANDIDIDHFNALRGPGEVMDEKLNMDLRENVVKIFEEKCEDQYIKSELKKRIIENVEEKSDILKEKIGKEALRSYLNSLADELKIYANSLEIKPRFPKYTNEELRLKYEAAKRITLKERILNTNNYDIHAFHEALMDRTWWDCRKLVIDQTREFLLGLAECIPSLA